MTGTPPRPLPPPRYEARNTDGSAGSRHLSRLDPVLPAVVTIKLRGGGNTELNPVRSPPQPTTHRPTHPARRSPPGRTASTSRETPSPKPGHPERPPWTHQYRCRPGGTPPRPPRPCPYRRRGSPPPHARARASAARPRRGG